MAKKNDINYAMFLIFGLILFLIPFNTRKVFLNQYTYFAGNFNDYVTYSLYFVDIVSIILVLFFVARPVNQLKQDLDNIRSSCIFDVFFIFLAWIILNCIFNIKYYDLWTYHSIRIFGYIGLIYIMRFIITNERRLIQSLFIISFSGSVQALIAILQFLNQSSVFGDGILHKMTGESLISPGTIGTSNIVVGGVKMIRSYGTFPHPNILAGYLVITILITLFLFLIIPRNNTNVNVYIYLPKYLSRLVYDANLLIFMLVLQLFGLLATFSRAGFFSLFIILIINVFLLYNNVSRETLLNQFKLAVSVGFSRRNLFKCGSVFVLMLVFMLGLSIFVYRMQNEFIGHQSLQDRILLENVSRETIYHNPIFGVGLGAYVLNLRDNYSSIITSSWQYQPDHNMYLLIASEIGIFGLVMYFYILFLLYNRYSKISANSKNVSYFASNMGILFRSVVTVIFILGFFDHYFWTSTQMMLFEWIIFGMVIGFYEYTHNVSRETL